jgi:hypothetical protein
MSKPAWRKLLDERPNLAYALVALALAALVLLPQIGRFGLWDPQEFPLADASRAVAASGDYAAVRDARPPLSIWASAAGIDVFGGPSELAARLPQALFALAAVMVVYAIARRLRGPRAGLIAAIVLVSTPLFLFQARQLTTDAGGQLGVALMLLGVVGLTWPASVSPRPAALALDALAIIAGAALAFLQWGLVHAALVPGAALALASGVALAGKFESAPRTRHLVAAAAAGVLLVASAGWIYDHWGAKAYLPLLGGTFRQGPVPPTATYDWVIDQLAFGLFPWCALAPIAVGRLAFARKGDRGAWAGILLLGWAVAGYAATTLWMHEIGEQRFPELVPVALAVALLVDDLLEARTRRGVEASGLPLLAAFVFFAALQIARDIGEFPEELASVHLLSTIKFPAVLHISRFVVLLGFAFAGLAALGLGLPRREPAAAGAPWWQKTLSLASRHALVGCVGVGYATGLFLAQVYTPRLSEHFSYKNVFDAYRAMSGANEPLAVEGIAGSGPDFYAKGKLDKLPGTAQLVQYLQQDTRVFAIAPSTEQCTVHQSMSAAGKEYHVVYDSNSRYYLFSNRLSGGQKDLAPLQRMIRRTPPEHIGTKMSAIYRGAAGGSGEIELLGYDMPASVSKRSTFKMTLYFKVNERVAGNQELFVHFDKGVRFQADHWPLDNLCGTQNWLPGDYITETFDVTAGDLTSPTGTYQTYVGFFTGSAGQWRNMKVTSGPSDGHDRVLLGPLQVK